MKEYTDIMLSKLKELSFTFYNLCCVFTVKICQSDWFNKKVDYPVARQELQVGKSNQENDGWYKGRVREDINCKRAGNVESGVTRRETHGKVYIRNMV